MKKLFCFILVLSILLLPASALAADRNMVTLSAGNFILKADDMTVSLPATLELGVGAEPETERGMAVLNLLAGEEPAGSVLAALENGQFKVQIDGMDYGLYLSLEDAVALLESEMGVTFEEMLTVETIPVEMQEKITRMAEALTNVMLSASLDGNAMSEPLGITIEEAGSAAVTIFDAETEAVKSVITMPEATLYDLIEATSEADSAWGAYWAAYYDLFLSMADESGAAISMEELDEVLQAVSMGFEADMYAAEGASLIELTVIITADGETLEIPMTITVQESETASRVNVSMLIGENSESMQLVIDSSSTENAFDTTVCMHYINEIWWEETILEFNINGTTSDTDGQYAASFRMSDDYSDVNIHFTLSTAETETGSRVNAGLYFSDGYDEASIGLSFIGAPAVLTDEKDVYAGNVALYVCDGYSEFVIGMEVGAELSTLPEGELLSLSGNSIDLLTADDDMMEQFGEDAQVPLINAVGTLMQVPEIAELLSGFMIN